MNCPIVSCQRARLGEPDAALSAREGLQVDVPLVVEDQTCALRERLVADGAVRVDEVASEMRLAGVSALDRDLDLLVGVAGQDLEACVVLPARDWGLLGGRRQSLSAPVAASLGRLVHSAKGCTLGSRHGLHRWRGLTARPDLDALVPVPARCCLLLLNMERSGGLHSAISVLRLWEQRRRLGRVVGGFPLLGRQPVDAARQVVEVAIAFDWGDELGTRKGAKEEGRLVLLLQGKRPCTWAVHHALELLEELDLAFEFAASFGWSGPAVLRVRMQLSRASVLVSAGRLGSGSGNIAAVGQRLLDLRLGENDRGLLETIGRRRQTWCHVSPRHLLKHLKDLLKQ